MQITQQYIDAQIDNLKKQKDQHLANANACEGALTVYEQLSDYLKTPPSEENPPHGED